MVDKAVRDQKVIGMCYGFGDVYVRLKAVICVYLHPLQIPNHFTNQCMHRVVRQWLF